MKLEKKTTAILIAILMISTLAVAIPVRALTDVYVSTEGNDENPGTVDLPFLTIQKGINVVDDSGTVHVAAGTYADIDINLEKSLSLVGEGLPTINGGDAAWGTIFVMGFSGESVTIDGFEIIGSSIDGIHSQEGSTAVLTITNNFIHGNARDGIQLHGTQAQPNSDGNTIEGNIITSNGFNGIALEWSSGNTVTDNDCSGNGRYGIYLWSSNDNTITYNDIYENDWAGFGLAEFPSDYGMSGNGIQYNNIWGNGKSGPEGVEGLESLCVETVDATLNWWGTANPVQIAAMVLGDVTYDPWLDAASPDGEPMSTNSVTMTATVELYVPVISISVSPIYIDFGTIVQGEPSESKLVTITSTSDVDVDVSASVTGETTLDFYTNNLKLNTIDLTVWEDTIVEGGAALPVELVLDVPLEALVDTYEGTLVFTAAEAIE